MDKYYKPFICTNPHAESVDGRLFWCCGTESDVRALVDNADTWDVLNETDCNGESLGHYCWRMGYEF